MNLAYKLVKIADKILNIIIYLCLSVALLYCLYALFDSIKVYTNASKDKVSIFKPSLEDPTGSLNALLKINPDVCGWITIDNTKIDYPVVIGKNNAEYLNKDVYKKYSLSGSLFLDYKNSKDFNDLYSVIYGHHMNGSAMFGDIPKFKNKDFFEKNKYGVLYTTNGVYRLEIFAFVDTNAYDNYVYGINKNSIEQQEKLIAYIKENAVNLRDIGINTNDNIIGLSTCSTATTNGRHILFVRITSYSGGD